jgi:hypothetical protein
LSRLDGRPTQAVKQVRGQLGTCCSPMARQRCRRGRERSLPWRVGAVQRGHVKAPGVGVDLQSGFLVATRGGKRQSSSGGAPFPSAGHGAEQEAVPAAPAFPTSPWRWAHALQCPGSPSSRSSPSPRSPLPSPLLLRWEVLGKKSPGGGGQGKSKGRPGFYTGGLGLGEATDGDDHWRPCPWPRGAHLAGRARCGAGRRAAGFCSVWGGAHGQRKGKGE